MNQEAAQYVEIGARIGRGQAFGMVANLSLASQAACLRQIRDSQEYKALELTWEEFCSQYVGMTRQRVDEVIHNHEEFGAAYFRLSEIVRISPETYRQIADKVEGEEIEIEGKMVPISPENAGRIRTAIHRLRGQLQEAKKRALPLFSRVKSANRLADETVAELTRMSELQLCPDERAALAGIADYAVRRLTKIREDLRG